MIAMATEGITSRETERVELRTCKYHRQDDENPRRNYSTLAVHGRASRPAPFFLPRFSPRAMSP
jgi:hypothetical protein